MLSKLFSPLRSALVGTLSLLATASLAQTTIHVGPGQTYTTIQSGIDAANTGDTVLVAPGTYNENIDFKGKAITVTSSGGAATTIIDGGSKPGAATVTFVNGETAASVISGFTITGGGDEVYARTGDGGVYIDEASPTIQSNTISANYCHNIEVDYGGATILNNEISGVLQTNLESGPNQSYCFTGSGIALLGNDYTGSLLAVTVIGNTIENNLTGSALYLASADYVLIKNNTIRNNISPFPGSAYTEVDSIGVSLVQNLIYKNTSACGGAIAPEETIFIANNTIVDNVATDLPGNGTGCELIAQIYPGAYGGGDSTPSSVIVNNIISGSTSYPAVNCYQNIPNNLDYQPNFEYNILLNAGGPFFGSYCVDVSDKYNNIASDPQFVDAANHDYHLKSTSPAIDSGQNSVLQTFTNLTGLAWTKDFDGNPRVQDATGKGCVIDMGAYEYHGTLSQCGVTETLSSSLNPATAGQSVTFTAQLNAASGTPTGAIAFLDGTNVLSTETISSTGSATFSTSSLAVGSHTITANYQPTGTFGASTASLVQVILGDATGTALTCQPNPIGIGSAATLTASVTSANGTPTGSIAFTDNGASLATQALLSGAASLTYIGSVAGTHTITANYTPTGPFAASSASCSEVVNSLPTTSTLTVAQTTSAYGSPVKLTATVSPARLPAPSTPTGTVTFLNGTSVIGTGTLVGGVATLSTTGLSGGSYDLTCSYGGSSIYAASNCNSVPVTVKAVPTALTLISSQNPAPFLSLVTLTARLTVNGQPAGAGKIIHLGIGDLTYQLTTDATGAAAYTLGTLLSPNSYPVTASFAGTDDLLASSASLTEVITAAPTSVSLTGTPNRANVNQLVTLTANVSSQIASTLAPGLVVSGNVTFYDGAKSIGSSKLSADGKSILTASFSTVGVHPITAVYAGDADFSSSKSAVFPETIVAGDFSILVKPAAVSVYTGVAAAVQVSVTSLQGFDQPLTLTCSNLPANATCTFSPSSLPNGQGGANLLIQTAAPHKTGVGSVTAAGSGSVAALGALTLLLLPGWRRRRFLTGLSVVLLAIGVTAGMAGCGAPHPITGGTPPGTYQVAVTATAAGGSTALTHSAVVTLTVKSLF